MSIPRVPQAADSICCMSVETAKQRPRSMTGAPRVSYPLSVGDPDGYGSFAELDDDGHTVGCHECGRRSRNLGLHVRVHAMTAAEYRQAHGLSTGQALIPADLARELAEHSRNSSTSLAARGEP